MLNIQPDKLELKSMSITNDQKAKLKQLFPEVFNEDKIDFDKLKATLGEEIDTGEERFGMTWPGKNECFKVIQTPSVGTLKPAKEESVNWDTTENLFIEGDNLEVLKLLQGSYYGKIKMIYIDPPYNTGNDFIYPDNYTESLETYLTYTGQTDEEGRKSTSNPESSGRFHSKWLNMIYPRLFLAKNLLREDGVIFISIDDNEASNLRKLCDEIFGENNFIADVVVVNNFKGRNDKKYIATAHERLLMYVKSELFEESGLKLPDQRITEFNKEDNIGKYRNLGLRKRGGADTRTQRPNMFFPIYINPETNEVALEMNEQFSIEVLPKKSDGTEGCWRWGYYTVSQRLKSLEGLPVNNEYGFDVFEKDYLETNGEIRRIKPKSIMIGSNYSTDGATKSFRALIESKVFDNPKSVHFLTDLVSYATTVGGNDIVLDFFAGSGTIAHAVMNLNIDDKGKRNFICIQLPEACKEDSEAYKAGYKTIADIGKERIRRVINKINEEHAAKEKEGQGKLPGMKEEKAELDLGFRVFKLDKSNFNVWDGTVDESGDVSEQIEMFIDHIDHNASEEYILYEILLKTRFPLTTKIEVLQLADKNVYSIADKALLICLDKKLTKEVITEIARLQPARVVCLDAGFANNDQLKTNAVQIMKSHGVEDFRTV